MFTRLGRHYSFCTPEFILDMTLPQIALYLEGIGDNLYREQYPTMAGWYQFMGFMRSWQKNPPPLPGFDEVVPPWMRPPAPTTTDKYSPRLIEAWRLAIKLGVASPHDIGLLGLKKLRASGWNARQ